MKSRIGVIAVVGVALLLWGTGASAEDIAGTEGIRVKNTRTNTVQLGERTFKLDGDTVIRNGAGNRINLAELSVPDVGRGESDPGLGSLLGKYTATQHGRRLTLVTLDLVVHD